MLLLGGAFVLIAGLCMLIWPNKVYQFIESWKSNGTTEPSKYYVFSIRFGGAVCSLVGSLGIVYFFVS